MTLNRKTPTVPVGKFLEENEKNILNLPEEFDTDSKVKKLKIASFRLVLPIIKGYEFDDGDIDNKHVQDSLIQVHDLYAEWIYLLGKNYIIDSNFTTGKVPCPTPEVYSTITAYSELPIKVLFKTKTKDSPFAIIKKQVDNFILANKKETINHVKKK